MTNPTQSPLIRLRGVSKRYEAGASTFTALHDLHLDIGHGECVAVVGKSGSGKTTLINLLTGIDSPSSGEVDIAGQAIHRMSQEELAVWRGRHVGVVFQFFQLLPTLTVVENVMLPMDFCAAFEPAKRRPRALALLHRLGIAEPTRCHPIFQAGSSNAPRSRGRSPTTRPSWWPTSPRATSTRPPPTT